MIPPIVEVRTIALGDAIAAFEHSSARWNGESYPDMVQMTATNDISTATPAG